MDDTTVHATRQRILGVFIIEVWSFWYQRSDKYIEGAGRDVVRPAKLSICVLTSKTVLTFKPQHPSYIELKVFRRE